MSLRSEVIYYYYYYNENNIAIVTSRHRTPVA